MVSRFALAACAFGLLTGPAFAQDTTPETEAPAATDAAPTPSDDSAPVAAEPADSPDATLPAVDIVQPEEKAAPKAPAQKKQAAKQQPAPSAPPPSEPTPVAADDFVDDVPEQTVTNFRPGTGTATSGTVNMAPGGGDLPIEKVPASVGRASSEDFARTKETNVQQALQATVPGVFVNDSQGNVFQGGVQFRGFESSPILGAPQGIAVYQEGTRINEVFGDVVNWDFLPSNAIDSITVLGANPVYGLNAVGGAIGITMRDGFNFQGVEFDTRFGSYGRVQGSAAMGMQAGNWGIFAAIEGIKDDGYRDFSESEVKRLYADLGYRTNRSEFHLSFTGADNEYGVTAAAPEELLGLDYSRTFTSPQVNENEMYMLQLRGAVKATERLTLSGQMYYRRFKQAKVDGNLLEAEDDAGEDCEVDGGPDVDSGDFVCIESEEEPGELEALEDFPGGNLIPRPPFGDAIFGAIDRVNQDNESFGGSVQAVDRGHLFGFRNQFLVGASWDHGLVSYTTASELGIMQPKFVVQGTGIQIGGDDFFPRDIDTTSDYFGLYFSNTTDLTSRLALTVGGRYNYARLELDNNFVPEGEEDSLSGVHTFVRFNPSAGLTYQLAPGLTAFGGYSEANRAPTAAELSCADPEDPCLIESLLVADPPLDQVVSRTFEVGLRGNVATFGREHALAWTLSAFHTRNEDDIISIAAPQSGRGFFDNIGQTQRQGIEASLQYQNQKLYTYASYAFTDAEFRENLIISAPDNPLAEEICPDVDYTDPEQEATCVRVTPGNSLPGIPRHKFKAGFNYSLTPKWKFGVDMIAASGQRYFGDEGNDNKLLPGFAKFNLHTSYQVTDNIQIYGLVDNVFDTRYGLFGTYFNTEAANYGAGADPALGDEFFGEDCNSCARTRVPAPPVTAYGGIKVKF